MLKRIQIQNFRSIRSPVELELKPLTILVGPNAAGKSSIFFAIDWLSKRSLRRPSIHEPPDAYEQMTYDVHNTEDYIFGRNFSRRALGVELKLAIPLSIRRRLEPLFNAIDWEFLYQDEISLENITYGFWYRNSPRFSESVTPQHPGTFSVWLMIGNFEIRVTQSFLRRKNQFSTAVIFGDKKRILRDKPIEFTIFSSMPFNILFENRAFLGIPDQMISLVNKMFSLLQREYLKNFFFLSGLRGWIPNAGEAEPSNDVGPRGEKIIEATSTVLSSHDLALRRDIGDWLTRWLQRFGLREYAAGMSTKTPKVTEASYSDQTGVRVPLSLASHGSRQISNVITQLIVTPKNSVLMIEEPEISLHPEMQTLLPLLFADVIKKHNKQLIITTHSSLLILSLMDAVIGRKGLLRIPRLKIEDIALYHVTRDKKHKDTEVSRIELTQEGLPKGGIPSFIEVEEALLKRMSNKLAMKEE